MKILFICKANVSRSQMAAALYNKITSSHDADSAGVAVDYPGETLAERKQRLGASNTLDVMANMGLDLSHSKRTQLTPDLLDGYDKIISMYDESLAPNWLRDDPRYQYWHVPDPIGGNMQLTEKTKAMILEKVRELAW